jgi:hypothetical protein
MLARAFFADKNNSSLLLEVLEGAFTHSLRRPNSVLASSRNKEGIFLDTSAS